MKITPKKWIKGLGVFGVLLVFLGIGGYLPPPLKITDPSNPLFRTERFRITDYHRGDELIRVVNLLFPQGTARKDVDRILLYRGGCRFLERQADATVKEVTYIPPAAQRVTFPGVYVWTVLISYDAEDRLVSVRTGTLDIMFARATWKNAKSN